MSGDIIEQAYWKFDAMRKGYGEWRNTPKSERDAFKSACAAVVEAENAQLKADIDAYKTTIAGHVKDEELYRLEIKALISVRGQMERGVAIMVTEINQLKAELAEAKAREARLLEALKSIGQIRFLLGNDPRLNPAYEMGAIAQHALKEAGT